MWGTGAYVPMAANSHHLCDSHLQKLPVNGVGVSVEACLSCQILSSKTSNLQAVVLVKVCAV